MQLFSSHQIPRPHDLDTTFLTFSVIEKVKQYHILYGRWICEVFYRMCFPSFFVKAGSSTWPLNFAGTAAIDMMRCLATVLRYSKVFAIPFYFQLLFILADDV